jgi:hypothetical protein
MEYGNGALELFGKKWNHQRRNFAVGDVVLVVIQ